VVEHVIAWSLRYRAIVLLCAGAIALLGALGVRELALDAIPDLSEIQVIVQTNYPGQPPQSVEDQVTYPLSVHLQGIRGVRVVRSSSDFNFSMINVIFSDSVAFPDARRRVLERLAQAGVIQGKTIGVDSTTLEANAALRSIIRRDTKETYQEFLTRLAQASEIETPTRADLAKLDRQRKNKGSNKDWEHPYDPDARIAKMKDGRTHLAYKAEHAVDLGEGAVGAVVAVTLPGADQGDTTTFLPTLATAAANMQAVAQAPQAAKQMHPQRLGEVVADKGYHSNDTLRDLDEAEVRSYVPESDRGRRKWAGKERERDAVYANRRRIRGRR